MIIKIKELFKVAVPEMNDLQVQQWYRGFRQARYPEQRLEIFSLINTIKLNNTNKCSDLREVNFRILGNKVFIDKKINLVKKTGVKQA
ncbi:hypothetical protein NE172_04865 [Clostridium botulinum]|uniref:Uncharacterized protein n=1 Tax=Clostridium botulinum TaxID=1491 RepID=A0A6B4JJB8_CLOBO|nr:hypothetical protein [Clostridium botulinum]EES50173.1 hypothetical protein CLO_1344 [Clostridium botulinum E1 str. 'BoNT E Beluga']MBY6760492.1 hypothetical protein [Clostridium botulinum]MBY6919399.1 hypothetical protein [Clostridium botulinum]MCR1130277.1 hypothetical protein [Clostridium botulinum]NFJ56961.1 hypothetical protein [Clostridium botulinum]